MHAYRRLRYAEQPAASVLTVVKTGDRQTLFREVILGCFVFFLFFVFLKGRRIGRCIAVMMLGTGILFLAFRARTGVFLYDVYYGTESSLAS